MSLTEKQWTILARDLQRALGRVAPDWTDLPAHDPGITVLEVLDYALTDLQYRHTMLDDRGRLLAGQVAERAGALAAPAHGNGNGNDDCGDGLQRVNYAHGMVLGVDDFSAEQDYLRNRLNRRNRLLNGVGIVSGLGVTVDRDNGASRVVIAPGLAFDANGNEIFVGHPVTLAIPEQGVALLVLLRYLERPCRIATLTPGAPSAAADDASTTQPTRIAETFGAELALAPAPDALAIARLRQARGRWRVDATFKAVRLPR